jgi:hypothetical protein
MCATHSWICMCYHGGEYMRHMGYRWIMGGLDVGNVGDVVVYDGMP